MPPPGWPRLPLSGVDPVPLLPAPGFVVPGSPEVSGLGHAKVLAPWRRLSRRRVAAVLEALGVGADDWFVDFGCGDGSVLEAALWLCPRVVGIELDPALAVAARARLAGRGGALVLHEPLGLRPLHGPTCGLLHLLPSAHGFFARAVEPELRAGFRLATVGCPYRPGLGPADVLKRSQSSGSVFVAELPLVRGGSGSDA